jgi:hypothetical protein
VAQSWPVVQLANNLQNRHFARPFVARRTNKSESPSPRAGSLPVQVNKTREKEQCDGCSRLSPAGAARRDRPISLANHETVREIVTDSLRAQLLRPPLPTRGSGFPSDEHCRCCRAPVASQQAPRGRARVNECGWWSVRSAHPRTSAQGETALRGSRPMRASSRSPSTTSCGRRFSSTASTMTPCCRRTPAR